jgi:hypothetical protein
MDTPQQLRSLLHPRWFTSHCLLRGFALCARAISARRLESLANVRCALWRAHEPRATLSAARCPSPAPACHSSQREFPDAVCCLRRERERAGCGRSGTAAASPTVAASPPLPSPPRVRRVCERSAGHNCARQCRGRLKARSLFTRLSDSDEDIRVTNGQMPENGNKHPDDGEGLTFSCYPCSLMKIRRNGIHLIKRIQYCI